MADTYADSVAKNKESAGWVHTLSKLGDLAMAVNAPGNDVFESGNTTQGSQRLAEAWNDFTAMLDRAQHHVAAQPSSEQQEFFGAGLSEVEGHIGAMRQEALAIFGLLAKGENSSAGSRMAVMDRCLANASSTLGNLRSRAIEL